MKPKTKGNIHTNAILLFCILDTLP